FVETAFNFERPDDCVIQWFRGLGDTAARRHNHCMEQALAWKADAVLILGSDQVYHDPKTPVKLVGHFRSGCDCVTALVPMRGVAPSQGTKPFGFTAFQLRPDKDGNVFVNGDMRSDRFIPIDRKSGDLVPCHAVGSGVLLFPASALETLER